ncbi:hypothetical protein B9T31_15440 [Acinetobacter sp. ANC 4558]|uniref:hypothetical protein n=1 Tax=Acinetobacter sp. ANC 4558 TaxID=1977876 RepID=UPI000A350581|nr:hypothetical protein [Acinetobacter sp. ANC 4558]OTG81207.1 hypothetical protein B9T31_15440 [Acinetobacter sp. ANC 4558]
MKMILWAYALIILVLIAVLSLLSYGQGVGYVYIQWRSTQIQTNIWVLFIFLAILSLLFQLGGIALKRYFSREKRKAETILNFHNLHPYEQLAVIWLLDAADDQQEFIQQAFTQSGLLKGVIDSQIYTIQGNLLEALDALDHTNVMAFELAEIQRIQIYLAQNEPEKALTHLEFISQHELSPWLNDVKSTYETRLTNLWGEFAAQYPWLYLHVTIFRDLFEPKLQKWLKKMLSQFEQATLEDIEALKQRYLVSQNELKNKSYETRVLWLKVLSRLPEMSREYEYLAIELLNEKFNQDVFYLWFQLQLLRQAPDYIYIENKLNDWEEKYPYMPIFNFVRWRVYVETNREAEAAQLLTLYPDNVLMNYLRVKSKLKGQDDLIQLLNTIFENNANFLEIKI